MNSSSDFEAREVANRVCITGYTQGELTLEAALLQEKYGHKERVWYEPCSEVDAFTYPDDVAMEYSYVVLK